MSILRIHFFGQPRVYRGDRDLGKFPTVKEQLLFCYLVLHRHRRHARDVLAGLLWGDSLEEQARRSLRTSLWRLRRFLEPEGEPAGNWLIIEKDSIGFNPQSNYWLDVAAFEAGLSGIVTINGPSELDPAGASTATRAVELYQGDLLEGCYEDWCLYERERLQQVYLGGLNRLMAHHRSRGELEEALLCGQRILTRDLLLEEVHREMMVLHCMACNRAGAVRQYRLIEGLLSKELGVEPMEETTALYQQICKCEPREGELAGTPCHWLWGDTSVRAPGRPAPELPVMSRMQQALRELQLVQAQFQQLTERAIQAVEVIKQELGETAGLADQGALGAADFERVMSVKPS